MKKIRCKIIGHTIIKSSPSNSPVKEYRCSVCKKEFTKDGYGQLVILDSFWKANNERLRKAKAL